MSAPKTSSRRSEGEREATGRKSRRKKRKERNLNGRPSCSSTAMHPKSKRGRGELAVRLHPSLLLLASMVLVLASPSDASDACPSYSSYAQTRHGPFSPGKYALSSQRPAPACRTFNSSRLESVLASASAAIADPDLARLFTNTYPNTLDTAVKWHGAAHNNSAEELTFLITGDINAMWLRDSTNQLHSYLPLLTPSPSNDSLASLFRGAINLQARYILTAPFCNAFQPPPESGLAPATNGAAASDTVIPPYDPTAVFECKYELDSLAAFLHLSADYHTATGDDAFFAAFQWPAAVRTVLETARAMMTPTYTPADGAVLPSPYKFSRMTTRATETLANDGAGSPVGSGTGLIRSAFRPSDDATLFQLLVPANMMFATGLERAAGIMDEVEKTGGGSAGTAAEMRELASGVRAAVDKFGVVHVPVAVSRDGLADTETIYAYEVDGFGSAAIMDDANIPSLLAAPVYGFVSATDPLYQRTRARILDSRVRPNGTVDVNGNPYFMRGSVISAVGGPHVGPGMAWPMASIVRILTSDDDGEIFAVLREILGSTDGLGLIHESVNASDASRWTRQWFSWANGLFGEMILDLLDRKPDILKQNFQ
ncbi:hypothetical protein B0T19DRAFT_416468 [Cercophora scortea]|uniref:Uncharacterized protein n=1 Tax=Cercophora scortea TaxID=314031 RepID=A0AAE0IX83_9PEZI|nr:hypothetical protein B0T19DRAFT_416468 [Cercophora scortea]